MASMAAQSIGFPAWSLDPDAVARRSSETVAGPRTPKPLSGKRLFDIVSAGTGYTCGVTLGDKGFCWGNNSVGQFGTGSTKPWLGPMTLGVDLSWSMIATSAASTCGITTDWRAWCWGDNSNGELGNGTASFTPSLLPTPVVGP